MKDSDTQSRQARRTLLKSIAGGGVVTTAASLPAVWSKPVVDTVMLPAHATTTGNRIVGGGGGGGGVAMLAPLAGLVQPAHADGLLFGGCISISYQSDGPNIDDVSNVVVDVLNVDCNEYEKVLCVELGATSSPLNPFIAEAVAGGDTFVWESQVTIAQSQPMTKTGTFNWETVVVDGGRSYTIELTFTTHTATNGQKFGDCTISKAWGPADSAPTPLDHLVEQAHAGSGGYTYETFALIVGETCPIVDDCLDECKVAEDGE